MKRYSISVHGDTLIAATSDSWQQLRNHGNDKNETQKQKAQQWSEAV